MLKSSYVPEEILVSFDYKEKHYNGVLSKVSGCAKLNTWHLMINKYYHGTLSFTDKWVFHNNKNEMTELADFFGECVTRFNQSKTDVCQPKKL